MASAAPRLFRETPRAPAVAVAALPVYRVLAVQLVLAITLAHALAFTYDGRDIDVVAALLAAAAGTALLARRHRLARLATALEGSALVLASSMLAGVLSLLLATLALPYRDPLLAAADGWMMPFASWPAMVRLLAPHDRMVAAMCWLYQSLLWQPFLAVALLAASGREADTWRFVHSWCLALVACLAAFALVPAVAAYAHYGVPASAVPALSVHTGWRPAAILAAVRAGELRTIATGSMAGLITFPSFHAAGATLLAWAFRRAPGIGGAMVAMNLAMLLTVPMIGSHYFVDVLAGIGVALLALHATRSPLNTPG